MLRLALILSLLLTACGGGDDAPSNASAEGFWTSSNFGMVVTNTGEVWAVDTSTATFLLLRGSVTTQGNAFSASFQVYTPTAVAASATGTVAAKSKITGTVMAQGVSSPFSLNYVSSYEAVPNRAALVGTYAVSSGGTVTLDANGQFAGTPNGCVVNGTLTPDASGRNFYRGTITFGQAPCSLPGVTAAGVLAPNGPNQLVGGFVSGTVGDAFVLTRM